MLICSKGQPSFVIYFCLFSYRVSQLWIDPQPLAKGCYRKKNTLQFTTYQYSLLHQTYHYKVMGYSCTRRISTVIGICRYFFPVYCNGLLLVNKIIIVCYRFSFTLHSFIYYYPFIWQYLISIISDRKHKFTLRLRVSVGVVVATL